MSDRFHFVFDMLAEGSYVRTCGLDFGIDHEGHVGGHEPHKRLVVVIGAVEMSDVSIS